ncbi:MAG: phosphoribosylanthranilate isomerase [Pseudomonadota bacterium]
MAKVKICGLTEPETLRIAVRERADWIGFVFVPESPRAITPEAAETLLMYVGEAVPVALLVNPDDAQIDRVRALGIRTLQLHGGETPEDVARIKARTGAEVWKAIGVSDPSDLARAETYTAADALLLDAQPPKGAARTGGHGATFDWALLANWTAPKPWLLAGGLTPVNVANAISATDAPAVDVSSGVEHVRGVKSGALIKDFIRAAKSA